MDSHIWLSIVLLAFAHCLLKIDSEMFGFVTRSWKHQYEPFKHHHSVSKTTRPPEHSSPLFFACAAGSSAPPLGSPHAPQVQLQSNTCPCSEGSTPRAHLVPSFILPELNIHLKMFKMKILTLNLIHSAFIFSVILVPNLWLGACCRCRARVCRCFCLSPQLFARKVFSQNIRRTKNNFVVG